MKYRYALTACVFFVATILLRSADAQTVEIGTWTQTSSFANPRASHQSFVHRGRIYVLGGYFFKENDFRLHADVQFADVQKDGSISPKGWKTTTSFDGPRSGHSCVLHNDTVYVIGGYGEKGYCADTQFTCLAADGSVQKWEKSPNMLIRPRSNFATVVHTQPDGKTYLYAVGGVGEVNGKTVHFDDVEFTSLAADGTPQTWRSCVYNFRGGRSAPACLTLRNRLYVVGGWGERVIEDVFGDVQSAPFEKDGEVGLWNVDPFAMRIPVYGHAALCIPSQSGNQPEAVLSFGGNGGEGNYFSNIQVARFATDGLSRGWVFSRSQIPIPRWGHTSILVGEHAYVIGGSSKEGFLSTVHFATVKNP